MPEHDSRKSGEYKLGEFAAQLDAMHNLIVSTDQKVNNILASLQSGAMQFKDLEHADNIIDMRLKAIEASREQSAQTKQSILFMVLDKVIGIALPWGAVAYLLWGKGTP